MSYHGANLLPDKMKAARARVVKALKSHSEEYDFIAVTGLSGAVMGGIVSIALNKPLVLVRKETDVEHHGNSVQMPYPCGKGYIFLDDFIKDGITLERVKNELIMWGRNREMVGFCQYTTDNTNAQQYCEDHGIKLYV